VKSLDRIQGAAEGSQKWGGTEQGEPKGQSSMPKGPWRGWGSWAGASSPLHQLYGIGRAV